jgi:hypothetical protein
MSTKSPSKTKLFDRGAESYLNALVAMDVFEQEVQDLCLDVCKHHESNLALQMGLDASDWDYYSDNSPEERWADLGVLRPAQAYGDCSFYLYLQWRVAEGGGDVCAARIWLDVYPKTFREATYERVRKKNPLCRIQKVDNYGLIVETLLKPNELASAGETLDALDKLVLEWLVYCKKAGGLNLKKYKSP